LLTLWPWAACGLCSSQSFPFLDFFSLVTRPKPPISQIVLETLNQASCDVYSPRAVETLIHQKMNVTDIVFFILYKIYFWFHRSVGLEVNINYITEKVSAMECPGVASLTLAM